MSQTITVYTLEHCPYCVRAKTMLEQHEIPYKEVRVNDDDIGARSELEEKSGMKTFPQIFHGNKVIGGFSDLQDLNNKIGIEKALK